AVFEYVDEIRIQLVLFHVLRIDEMCHAEFLGHRSAGRIDVEADDHVGADHASALDDVEADATQTEDHDIAARRDLRRVDHRADAGGDAAADVADLVEGCVL